MYLIKIQSLKNKKEYQFIIIDKERLQDALKKHANSKKVKIEVVGELCLK